MTKEEIKEELFKLIGRQFGVHTYQLEMTQDFVYLGVDSLDSVELWMAVEEVFNIEIPDEQMEGVESIQQMYDVVCEKLIPKEVITDDGLKILSIDPGCCGGQINLKHVCTCKEKCQACNTKAQQSSDIYRVPEEHILK